MKKETKTLASPKKKEPVETWSTSIKRGDMSKRIEVEKLKNQGYLVSVCIYGQDSKGKYIDNTEKYYSESNPLEPEDDPITKLFSTLSPDKY